jgi:hypothetical protein
LFKAIYRASRLLTTYSLVFPLFFSWAMQNDTSNDSAQNYAQFGAGTHTSSFVLVFVIVLFVYLLRLIFLLWPKITDKNYAHGWVKGGIIAAFFPELILLISVAGYFLEDSSSCVSSGPYGNCGWSFILYVVLGLSCIMQVIGMFIGGLIGKRT